jgi:phosphinothricin acetyltransferase
VNIEPMTAVHADAVLAIYQAGLDTGNASFETTAPDWPTWDTNHLPDHRYVAVDDQGCVVGWVAASPVSGRCVYAGVIEHSVYVLPTAQGRGVGRALLEQLIVSAEEAGIWTIETGIFPENAASLDLHEAVGFRVVGRRERIGQHFGLWRDTLLLEHRR